MLKNTKNYKATNKKMPNVETNKRISEKIIF